MTLSETGATRWPKSARSRWIGVLLTLACGLPATGLAGTGAIAERSVGELRSALAEGRLSSEALTSYCLARIEALDDDLDAVIAVDPTAMEQARRLDAEHRAGHLRGPLHGLPVLIKDNIETRDQPTTAGSLALAHNDTHRDAPLVKRLRDAGLVILGKTNLSEWANFRSERSSSGWSGVGGQTRNAYDATRSPCGSSSGSAVAVAAGLAPLAVGTETDGSVVCPASVNGVVGIKPTVGLVSRTGVVPISHSQDTPGPFARDVEGAALLLQAMAGPDPDHAATGAARGHFDLRLDRTLDSASLKGVRIGVVRSEAGFHNEVDRLLEKAISDLQDAGAEIVDGLQFDRPEGFSAASYRVLLYEFKHDLNAYLAGLPDDALSKLTLEKLIAFNSEHARDEMPWFGQRIFEKSQEEGGLDQEEYRDALSLVRRATRADGIDRLVRDNDLDVLIAPTDAPAWKIDLVDGDHSLGGSSTFPAVAGYPDITVPMGMVHGLPVGISFMGGAFSESRLIGIAAAYEKARTTPVPPPGIGGEANREP